MTEKRARGKHKPINYDIKEIKEILERKINKEVKNIVDGQEDYNKEELNYNKTKINTIGLFCGAGGLDLGFELAGLDCTQGEITTNYSLKDKKLYNTARHRSIVNNIYVNDFSTEAIDTYKLNFPKTVYTHNANIKKTKHFPKADLVLGGFPCPGFSAGGPRLIDDPRNFLYIHFIRCLITVMPQIFVAENVKGILSLGKGEVFSQIKQDFEAAGYKLYHKLVNSRDYGVPQLRERVFLVGVRDDIDFEYTFPKPTHGKDLKPYVTLEDAIGDIRGDPGEYFTGSYSSMYMSRNRKKQWNDQSFTIQASGRQAPLHPDGMQMIKLAKDQWSFPDGKANHRRLSVKEIARIQCFPDWYEFSQGDTTNISDNGRINKSYKLIGNAVPVELARAIARPIVKWFLINDL
jgi:DNA (cytosine-5)-methyltransferase 1